MMPDRQYRKNRKAISIYNMPDELKDKLKAAAAENDRPLYVECLSRLERSFVNARDDEA